MENNNEDVITLDKNEYESMQSQLQELQEKNKSSTQEGQRLHHTLKFYQDPSYINDLVKNDKKVAEGIASSLGYETLDELLAEAKNLEKVGMTNVADQVVQKIEEKQQKQEEQTAIQQAIDEFVQSKDIDVESDFGKDVMREFEDIVGKRQLSPEKATKRLRMAFNEANKTSEHVEEYNRKMQELRMAGMSGASAKKTEDKQPVHRYKRGGVSIAEIYAQKAGIKLGD